jgi:hypothetical protein
MLAAGGASECAGGFVGPGGAAGVPAQRRVAEPPSNFGMGTLVEAARAGNPPEAGALEPGALACILSGKV